ncbi:MAG: pentapeptide repeat-containing protein [Alphaproteobacteria bacterium]|nr:pentapeptide repeat-containing protein [Alphaproteobacteria bacterium]
MSLYNIQSTRKSTPLFEGEFASFQDCLEAAVQENRNLEYADLRLKNLRGINLDDARLTHADLSGANLTGANLSEARLLGANFTNAALFDACFAYSDLQHCIFEYSHFGGTDITGSNISFSHFAGISCYSLDFINASSMRGCTFKNAQGHTLKTSEPPVVILGLKHSPIVFTHEKIGSCAQRSNQSHSRLNCDETTAMT